jgi:hypothetical protein
VSDVVEHPVKTERDAWRKTIAPLAARLRVAAALPGTSASWNSVGSKAFLEILKEMAWKLDVVVPRRIAALEAELDAARAAQVEAEARVAALEAEIRAGARRGGRSWRERLGL